MCLLSLLSMEIYIYPLNYLFVTILDNSQYFLSQKV